MIHIAERVIDSENPYIIAEIGSNFSKVEDCIQSIKTAKLAGADCVKFQLFDFKSLYGLKAEKIPGWYNKKTELPIQWAQQLKESANENRIHLMFSSFSPDYPRHINHIVDAHKIASSEINYVDLLEVVASLGKPIFVSVGGAGRGDIEAALNALEGCPVILNYCVGAYPAKSTNLYKIDQLKKEFGVPVGFSDHSLDYTYLPMSAVKNHGACAIEKHLNCVGSTGPDSPHSLNPSQFMTMVEYIKGLKEPIIGRSSEENDMVLRHKRRLVATEKIPKGGSFVYGENFGSFRVLNPETDYLTPFYKSKVDGSKAKNDIMPGKAITALDI